LGLLLPLQANAVNVQVGYADNLRASPFFPTPFFGDPNVALFAGESPLTHQLDSGAIRIFNNTLSNFVITSLDVKMRNGAGTDFNLWASFLGAGFTLLPGQSAIFVQTSGENFDSSDGNVLLGTVDPTNNCSIGAAASTATCLNNPAQVILNGGAPLLDTGHVLDTGGYDSVFSNPCIGGNNANNQPGGCNESLQWRDIGTTGVGNPGGNVPEPATLLLLGSGLAGLFALRYRKQT
jgi:hypothetical protein